MLRGRPPVPVGGQPSSARASARSSRWRRRSVPERPATSGWRRRRTPWSARLLRSGCRRPGRPRRARGWIR